MEQSPLLIEEQGEDKKKEKVDNEEKLGERWWDEEDYDEDEDKVPELIDGKDYDEDEDKLPRLLNEQLVKLLRAKSEIPPGIGIGGFEDGCAADGQTKKHAPNILHFLLYKRGWSCSLLEETEQIVDIRYKPSISNETKCTVGL